MNKFAILFVLVFSMVVSGCSGIKILSETENETKVSETIVATSSEEETSIATETTKAPTETTTAPTETTSLPKAGDVVVVEDIYEESYTDPDDNIEIFHGFVQSVHVEIPNNTEAADRMNEVLDLLRDESIASIGVTREDAISMFDEYGIEGFIGANAWETTVLPSIISDRIISFSVGHYMYFGGAHGGYVAENYSFDVQTGDHLQLEDICTDSEAFKSFIFGQIIAQIELVPDMYFPEYATSVEEAFSRASWEFADSNGAMSFVVTYQEYDLAAYAFGLPGFAIPLSDCVPYFNAYGQSLIEGLV